MMGTIYPIYHGKHRPHGIPSCIFPCIPCILCEITGNLTAERPAEIKSLKNVFKPGDLLYEKLRPNLNKVWVADREGICSTDIFVIRPIEGQVIPTLYGHIFRSTRFNDAVLTQLKGAQLPRIGWASFAEIQIPLSPLDVQQAIVAEIEGYQEEIRNYELRIEERAVNEFTVWYGETC